LTLSILPATLMHVAIAVYFVRHERRIGMAFALVSLSTSIDCHSLTFHLPASPCRKHHLSDQQTARSLWRLATCGDFDEGLHGILHLRCAGLFDECPDRRLHLLLQLQERTQADSVRPSATQTTGT
jgi:hypothetical protein